MIEGHAIPSGRIDFLAPRTTISKYAVILAMTEELLRAVDARALRLVEQVSLRALRRGEDTLLLSDAAAVAQGNPAGLLNGLSAIGGGSPATLTDDFSVSGPQLKTAIRIDRILGCRAVPCFWRR